MHIGDHKIDIDLRGMLCPMTFVKLRVFMDALPPGATFKVAYDASPANSTVPASVGELGHMVRESCSVETPDPPSVTILHIQISS